MDYIPFVAQGVKLALQVIGGDSEGATKTCTNLLRRCPGVSQGVSAYKWWNGDTTGAWEEQKQFATVLDSMPIVGHLKGCVHLALGDQEGFETAEKAASRTTATMLGGTLGFVTGGPPGAYAVGMAGGVAADSLTTAIESTVKGEYRPAGIVDIGSKIWNGNATACDIIDGGLGILADSVTGLGAGEKYARRSKVVLKNKELLKEKKVLKKNVETLEKNVNSLDGNTLKEMHEKAKRSHSKFIQAKESGISNRKRNVILREIERENPKHTGNNLHGLYRDSKRLGQIVADEKLSVDGAPRGAGRVILQDVNRNYQLHVIDYTEDHNYLAMKTTVQRPAYAKPFDYVADHPNAALGSGLARSRRSREITGPNTAPITATTNGAGKTARETFTATGITAKADVKMEKATMAPAKRATVKTTPKTATMIPTETSRKSAAKTPRKSAASKATMTATETATMVVAPIVAVTVAIAIAHQHNKSRCREKNNISVRNRERGSFKDSDNKCSCEDSDSE